MADSKENLTVLVVDIAARGIRLDRWLATVMRDADGLPVSRARIQRLLEAGDIKVDSILRPGKYLLQGGERIEVALGASAPSQLEPIAMDLAILFEDPYLIVIDKPAGIAMHPGAGDTGPTLVQGLLHYVQSKGSALSSASPLRPGIVHRLDKDTTGAVVIAKTDAVHAALAKQFHDKTNKRVYYALLDGVMNRVEVQHESYLFRDPRDRLRFASLPLAEYRARGMEIGRYARSLFKCERIYGHRLTLARVVLATGRTHQIRVHALDLGLPIVGDAVYNHPTQLPNSFAAAVRGEVLMARRQMLHAAELGFTHPITGQFLQFSAPYPNDFRKLLEMLEPYAQMPN